MNYDRYTVPVIVAATIHAALLIWIPPQTGASITPPVHPVPQKTPPIIVEMTVSPPEDPGETRPRGGTPVNQVPDISPPAVDNAVFTVPTSDDATKKERVTFLPTNPHVGPGNGGDGPWRPIGSPPPIDIGGLDRTPRTRVQPAPLYPAALRANGTEGRVVIEFTVDTAGRVTSATVLSSTQREFEDETIRAVMKWRFEPGRRNGRAVPFRMTLPLEFRLNDGA